MLSRLLTLCLVLCCLSASRNPAAVTKGDGAKALLTGIKQTAAPALPKLVVPPATTKFYAVSSDSIAGYSNEISTNSAAVWIGWSPGSSATNYTVWRGTNSHTYNRSWPAGTNLSLRVPPLPPSNVVVTISGSKSWTATNPPGMMMFTGKNLTISKRYQ